MKSLNLINGLVNIGSVIALPFKFIMYILHVPNLKICYKSGNSKYVFFKEFNITTNNDDASATWETYGSGGIILLNPVQIESVFKLY